MKEARKLLSEQHDFSEQWKWLKDIFLQARFSIDFYLKYHCEFNYIEMFWGATKKWSRGNCAFNFNNHIQLVPKALDCVSVSKIMKFARKSYRYMDAYRVKDSKGNSLTCRQIEHAVKLYRGHRKIPLSIFFPENKIKTTVTHFLRSFQFTQLFANPIGTH